MTRRWYRDTDDYLEGQPELACAEANPATADVLGAPKTIGPVRGFGVVWCEEAAVMTALGAATAPERGGPAFSTCRSQLFQGGLVIHNPNEEHRSYWVLVEEGARWRRYDE